MANNITTEHNERQSIVKERQPAIKNLGKWLLFLALITGLAAGGIPFYNFAKSRFIPQSPPPSLPKQPIITNVGALGRIEPQGEVIRLSTSYAVQGALVGKLYVRKGDRVRRGQVVAVLDTNASRVASLKQAEAQVKIAEANLAKVKAGAKQGDINAQKATIARIEAERQGNINTQGATVARLQAQVRNADIENKRYQSLYQDGAISASQRDSKQLALETAQKSLQEAKETLSRTKSGSLQELNTANATLDRIVEVRPTDVQAAQADVNNAIAAVKHAQAEVELTNIRASLDGQVIKIHSWPGETISNDGIMELAQTNQMYVVAEVYQTDIEKVRIGQSATITSEAFSGKLQGVVTEMGLQVSKQSVFNVNPKSDTDRKIIEVKVRLKNPEDSRRVSDLTNLQVQVVIRV